jgi:integrase
VEIGVSDPRIIRAARDGLCVRLDGSPAAANTIARKRAVFHGALGYAVELRLLPVNPVGLVRWRAPKTAVALSPATVASPAQVRAILAEVSRVRPELAAFFGCLYYAALRPEEAVALRRDDLILPARGSGKIVLTAACPHRHRLGQHWHTVRAARPQAPPRRHHPRRPHPGRPGRHAPPAPGRIRDRAGRAAVPRCQGGILSESVYGRAWRAARQAALGPGLAATALARRPYDLRHAALSLWLNATGQPAEVAARAGTSTRVLHDVYVHCTSGQDDTLSQRIQGALDPGVRVPRSSRCGKASGYTHRRHHPRPCPLTCIAR